MNQRTNGFRPASSEWWQHARQVVERRLLAALEGDEATPMTAADWDDIKEAVKTKIAARAKKGA
jgi:hypothetical protein